MGSDTHMNASIVNIIKSVNKQKKMRTANTPSDLYDLNSKSKVNKLNQKINQLQRSVFNEKKVGSSRSEKFTKLNTILCIFVHTKDI